MKENSIHYKAFISYSHSEDSAFAPILQSEIQRFNKPWYRFRSARIFRDTTNLTISPELWSDIQKALDESEYFIYLASPKAASSQWVQKEIKYWFETKSSKNFLIILTSGNIQWNEQENDFDWKATDALPKHVLSKKFECVPLFLDFREVTVNKKLAVTDKDFRRNIAKIHSKICNKELDFVIGEDYRQHRKTIRIAWTAVLILLLLAIAAVTGFFYARNQKKQAEIEKTIAELREKIAVSQNLLGTGRGQAGSRSSSGKFKVFHFLPSTV